jgi:hypothetical protein
MVVDAENDTNLLLRHRHGMPAENPSAALTLPMPTNSELEITPPNRTRRC